jgi:hypothetical protein
MAIDKIVFATELKSLSDWFNRPISESDLAKLYLIFSNKLTTDEFKQAVIWAWENCNSFPAPAKMIEAVQGNLEDKALVDWTNITVDANLLSPVGRKALQSIGGSSTVRMSENPAFLKKDFIAAFKAFAINAAPDDLRSCQLDQTVSINRLQAQRESA